MKTDFGPTTNQRALVGRAVAIERKSESRVGLVLDGVAVGELDGSIAAKVAAALDRGQAFTATVENAFPRYDEKFQPNGAYVDLKFEYLLEKGQPAIQTEEVWRCVPAAESVQKTNSFFTKVAGVSFEGRQRVASRCSVGERLVLVRDPDNSHDSGAIKVVRLNGEQLGFIPAHVSRGGDSSGLASRMDRGVRYQCRISDLTGGGGNTLGVNIEVTHAEEFETPERTVTSTPAESRSAASVWFIGAVVLIAVVLLFALLASMK
jgi:hypothetical protein